MKLFKLVFMGLFLVAFSCSNSDDSEEIKQTEGAVSFALSSGGGFIVENVKATISSNYGTSKKATINITGATDGGHAFTMSIVDNDDASQALVKDAKIPFGDNSKPFYATVRYVDNKSTFSGQTGTLDINKFEKLDGSNAYTLNAIFNTSNGTVTMGGNISGLIIK